MDLSAYRLATLYKDGEFVLCRGHAVADPTLPSPSVLISILASEHPLPAHARMLEHEFGLRNDLDPTFALRPLVLGQHEGHPALILEHQHGEPLARILEQSAVSRGVMGRRSSEPAMELGLFLRLAVALARTLSEVHRRGIIHKDVKPAHVLVNAATRQVWLTGFGIASRLSRERQALTPPETIAGTLAYMAPEQTGRMNRSVDGRSDLYALGVTLYQMLTGSLPFIATEPIEWVHCHIARQPMPLGERVADVPAPVSAIVMKLLAKNPEERYQTAAGVERDLRRCLDEWETRGVVDEFPLGESDYPDRLMMPERLYGRESQIGILLAAFDDVVAGGNPRLVLVSGHPGIGKSSVVNELHKVLVPPRALFASGKFDQIKRDIPYATVAQAFQSLIRQLLAKPEAELSVWRGQIRRAVDPDGALVTDLVPELKFVIGEQLAISDFAPTDAKARVQAALRRLIGVFACAEHPLALFLDDLQWLDGATLELLENIFVEPERQHLLVIGAYRDNEVDAAHPLMRTLSAIRESGAIAQEVALGPLEREDLAQWFADALHCQPERTLSLAQLVHEKTAGNPFFANHFLQELVADGLINFDIDHAWLWDVAPIRNKGYTDNVVDLMVGKLSRLPPGTQEALKGLAFLGNRTDISTLVIAHGGSAEEVHSDLWEALRLELIVRSDDVYRFAHDRVQEAAYSLIPVEQRAPGHLRIGRLLIAAIAPDNRDDAIFEIVGHYNRASSLITFPDEREEIAALNLLAGKRAMKAGAFVSALNYLIAGEGLIEMDNWRRHDLAFDLALHRGECEFLTGDVDSAERRLRMLSSRAVNLVERAAVACRQADVYMALERLDDGLVECAACLRQAGLDIPLHATEAQARAAYDEICSTLCGVGIEVLDALPLMTDPISRAILDVIASFSFHICAASANKPFEVLIVCAAVHLNLEHGIHDAACYAFVHLGYLAAWRYDNFEAGFRFGQLGYGLVERKGLRRFEALVCMIFSSVIMPWSKHVTSCRSVIRRTSDVAHSTHNRQIAVSNSSFLLSNLLLAGDPLVEVEREAEARLAFCRTSAFVDWTKAVSTQAALIRNLRGSTTQFGSLDDQHFDELQMESYFATQPHLLEVECWYWVRKLQARFFAGDYAAALDVARRGQALLFESPGMLERAEHELFSALTHAAVCEPPATDESRQHLEAMVAHHRQLEIWARNCPENFENRAFLVSAEIARIEGRDSDAALLYERAIGSARENGLINSEALALELAGRFYAARGFDRISKAYIRDARYSYQRWGADGKVRQLHAEYPCLTDELPSFDPKRTVLTPVEHLDLSTVLKMSQAVQGETDLEKLIAAIMRLGLEHAGADRGLLIAPHRDTYRIEAEARTSDRSVIVDLRQSSIGVDDLPQSVLQYVLRTRERVLLQDALAAIEFADDEYLRRHPARSVLCIPLLKQTRLAGIIYLENNLTSSAFKPARIALLEVLASDAAISLENARLYHQVNALKDQLYKENLVLRDEVVRISMFEEIVGTSPAIQPVLARVAKVARTDSTVLITGETGTGKELVARAIHRRSARASRAFVSVNCAATPRELIASELFGHEKGAFTGAAQRRLGRFELAHGGTIFLDEVGELPMETQVALLRVLQEREFTRVGGTSSVRVDVRVVAATNRDLPAAIEAGTFRSDLFYRLNVFPISVPPLRQRADDIPLLVEYFIDRYARKAGKAIRRVSKRTLDHLRSYPWPGNVRELQNVIERSVIVCDTDEFAVDESWLSAAPATENRRALSSSLASHERTIIEDALRASGGRVFGPSGAAARLGIARSTLESKIRGLGIDKNRFRRSRTKQ